MTMHRVFVLGVALAAVAAIAASLPGQIADSARVGPPAAPPAAPAADTFPSALTRPSPKPPVSPKRALFESLLVPGWGQASLHRSTAGVIFVSVEAISLGMLAQSKSELKAAQRFAGDSIWNGSGFIPNPLAQVVGKRELAVQDWTVLLIFNHLISAADAFVAAQLWNVPIELGASPAQKSASIGTHIKW
jgi:hypothetical protein